jgi:multiple sugar transport system permease protein
VTRAAAAAGRGGVLDGLLSGRRWLVAYVFLAPAAVIMAGVIAYPLIDGISTAFTDRQIARPGTYIGFDNFTRLLGDPNFARAAWNSLVLTIGTVAAKLVLGMVFALTLVQPFPMRGLLRALAFLPWAVPGLIAGLGWKWLYDEQAGVLPWLALNLGLVDRPIYFLSDPGLAIWSIAIAMIWHGLPFYTMMLLAALSTLPSEVNEAAHIDGAGPIRRFFEVTLPQLREVIAVTVMLSTIWTFNSFHMVYILTGGGPAMRTHILPTLAYDYAITRSQLGLGAAVLVSVIPLFLLVIFFLSRRMLRGKLE